MDVPQDTPNPLTDPYSSNQPHNDDAVRYMSPDWNNTGYIESMYYLEEDWVRTLFEPNGVQSSAMSNRYDLCSGPSPVEYGLMEGMCSQDALAGLRVPWSSNNSYLIESEMNLDTRLAEAAQKYGVNPLEVSMCTNRLPAS